MKKKFLIVSTARDNKQTLLQKSLLSLNIIYDDFKLDVLINPHKAKSLQTLYNSRISKSWNVLHKYVIFCHDDITILDEDFLDKIEEKFDEGYSVVGLVGTKECVIKDINLWHVMNNVKSFHNASGRVAHYKTNSETEYFWSDFGPTSRVILLDGLFLAVKLSDLLDNNICFDETNPSGFHHYDLDFCLQCNEKKLKLTTCDVRGIHKSHGLESLEDKEWKLGNEWFKNKWKR